MSATVEEKVQKQEKPLDGVFPSKWHLDLVEELLREELPGYHVRGQSLEKLINFIESNVSMEDLPEKWTAPPQF